MDFEVFPEALINGSQLNRIVKNGPYFDLAPAMFHIVSDNGRHGSGFFFKIGNDVGLFTNNHVLSKWTNFTLINQVKRINRTIQSSDIKWIFTDPDLDVSFYVLHDDDVNDFGFLEEWEDTVCGDITILQYPNMPDQIPVQDSPLYWASGGFTKFWGHFILHRVSTASMSAGGAMLLPNTTKVIGIHKEMRKITNDIKKNIGIRIRDIIECIRWETRKRKLYSPNILRVIEGMPHKSPQTSVFEMKFTSGFGVHSTGFLCSLEDEDTHLKGVLTTFVQTDVRRGFHMHFYGDNIHLDVQSEDICLVFTDPQLNFIFMVLTEHFICSTILTHKLNFLSTARPTLDSKVSIQQVDRANSGIVRVIDGDILFVRNNSLASIGTPVLNNKKQVIGIVQQNIKDNLKAVNLQKIREFIFKKRVFGDQDMKIATPQNINNMQELISGVEVISFIVYLWTQILVVISLIFIEKHFDGLPKYDLNKIRYLFIFDGFSQQILAFLAMKKNTDVPAIVLGSLFSKDYLIYETHMQWLYGILMLMCPSFLRIARHLAYGGLLHYGLVLYGVLLYGILLCVPAVNGQMVCAAMLKELVLYGLRLYEFLLYVLLLYGLLRFEVLSNGLERHGLAPCLRK